MNCTGCGYDLKAHSSGDRCPECGLAFDESVRIERKRSMSPSAAALAVRGLVIPTLFLAGCVPLFIMFAHDFNGLPLSWQMRFAMTAWPAFVIGCVGRMISSRDAWVWPCVFALPALAVSMTCFALPPEDSGSVVWLGIGPGMLVAGLAGVLAGRWLAVREHLPAM